jgi:nucleoside-diphosphate-sugar epimerase
MHLVMGGHGFVGSGVVRALRKRGIDHVIVSRQNYAELKGMQCDLFINANGNSRKQLAREQPLDEFDASVRSVRSSLADFRFRRYILLSSCDVYPDCSSPVATSEDTTIDVSRQSPYGFHKYLAEQCVRHQGAPWIICRMGGFVGPGLRKNAIFDILNGGPLWLDPRSELQFLHVDALSELVLALADRGTWGQVYNVCGRGVVCLQDVIERCGRKPAVMANSPRVRYDVDIRKFSELFPVPDSRTTVFEYIAQLRNGIRKNSAKPPLSGTLASSATRKCNALEK